MSEAATFTALGENWWMSYIDGNKHYLGKHVFDSTFESKANGQDGNLLLHLRAEYDRFATAHAWENYANWNASSLAAANSRLRGMSSCQRNDCRDIYSQYFLPRERSSNSHKAVPCVPSRYPEGSLFEELGHAHDATFWTTAAKTKALDQLLANYYADIDKLKDSPSRRPRGFSRLAALYVALADLHPFQDANSRSRLLVLQTELVRLGGHPVMLEELGWGIYFYQTRKAFETKLLSGSCAWEHARKHGVSPFPANTSLNLQGSLLCCKGQTEPKTYTDGCAPLEYGAVYYDPVAAKCVQTSLEEATNGPGRKVATLEGP